MSNMSTVGKACNITTGRLDSNHAVSDGKYPFFTCAAEPDKIDSYAFDDNVVLIAGNNAQGNFHVNRYKGKFNAYQRTYVLTAKSDFDIDYIYYSLKLELKRLKTKSQGSQTKFLTMPILTSIILNDISKDAQQRISAVLSSLDAKIKLNNCINAELETMAKTIYDYWFVQFDFPFDFSQGRPCTHNTDTSRKKKCSCKPYKSSGGEMVWNAKLKREIPKGWEVMRMGDVAIVKAGGDKPNIFSSERSNACSIPIYSNGIINEGLYGYTNEALITVPSVTISARGTIGYCVLRNHPFVPIIRLIVVAPNELDRVNYFYHYIKGIDFGKSGSVQQQLTSPSVSNLFILLPESTVLETFNLFTEKIFKEINVLKNQSQQLSELRDWLLPMLMNGQAQFK